MESKTTVWLVTYYYPGEDEDDFPEYEVRGIFTSLEEAKKNFPQLDGVSYYKVKPIVLDTIVRE